MRKTGYSRPHTVHCGPEGIYISTLGGGGAGRHRRARRASSSWTARASRSSGSGRSTAGRRSCTTTSGGTCRATTWCPANGACRRSSRTASSPKTCWPTSTATRCISGTCATRRHVQTHRPRRQPPDGAGDAPGARPDARIRFPRRGRRHDQPRRLDLDLVPRRRQVPREEDRDDSAGAGRCGAAARAAQGLRRRAAADQRHRPVARRPLPVRRLLGHRRAAAVRRDRPDEADAGRQRAHRRHCAAHEASERLEPSAAARR